MWTEGSGYSWHGRVTFYLFTLVIVLAFICILLWIGDVRDSMSCSVHHEEPKQTSCLLFNITYEVQPYANDCGIVTNNYILYISALFNTTQDNNSEAHFSNVCDPTYCLSSTGGGCMSKSCTVFSSGCGPVVTTNLESYTSQIGTIVDCWYKEATANITNRPNFSYPYWTYLEPQSCYPWYSITCLVLSVMIFLCGVVLFIYFAISEYRLHVSKKSGDYYEDKIFRHKLSYSSSEHEMSDQEQISLLKD